MADVQNTDVPAPRSCASRRLLSTIPPAMIHFMKLVFQNGPLAGMALTIQSGMRIGRGSDNAIAIPETTVSLVHAEITLQPDGRWLVRDLGSTNGTFLDGQRIVSGELRHGAQVAFGANRADCNMPAASQFGRIEVSESILSPRVGAAAAPKAPRQPSATPAADDLTGSIFAQVTYFLKRKLAKGGMGAVYEAEQFGAEGFVKTVAIKTILPQFARHESFVASFVGEAKLVANLVHPNIVQIHHLGRHGDTYFIAMEYIEGISLFAFLSLHRQLGQRVPVEIATYIISRICRGLEYAHARCDEQGNPLGIVHRDLSPNNILINREGEVKITDFGVARARRYLPPDEESLLVGCIEFMSPEQAACGDVDGRSDLFSLGLLYYELLTGIRVFLQQDDALEDAVARIQECEIPNPLSHRPDLPPSVMKTLLQCLARERTARPATAGELAYALESEMYAKGYGPTIVTLAKYVKDLRAAGEG